MATLLLSILGVLIGMMPASAAPLFLQDFHLHDFDAQIIHVLGHDRANVAYFSELASVTENEASVRRKYEPLGCYPFYVMKDGTVQEAGYNCGTFSCTGLIHGPKQCIDRNGAAFGGVSDINERMGRVSVTDTEQRFDAFPVSDRTPQMLARINELASAACHPLYLMHFDVVVGEGYTCDQIGTYPNFSGAQHCVSDWRTKDGMQCDVTYRPNEMDVRTVIVRSSSPAAAPSSSRNRSRRASFSPSSISSISSSMFSGSSASSESFESSASPAPRSPQGELGPAPRSPQGELGPAPRSPQGEVGSFSDVLPGKYGYTAITAMAAQGLLKGYPDGTFRPGVRVTRAEFLTLLARATGTDTGDGANCFPDVRMQWFSAAVCTGRRLGWIAGYGDGTFKPENPITRGEAITVLNRALNLPVAEAPLPLDVVLSAWYAGSVRNAVAAGLVLEPQFFPGDAATRADAAVWMYRMGKLQAVAKGE